MVVSVNTIVAAPNVVTDDIANVAVIEIGGDIVVDATHVYLVAVDAAAFVVSSFVFVFAQLFSEVVALFSSPF